VIDTTGNSARPAALQGRNNTPGTAEAPIRITTAKLQVNPALLRGYEAFTAGRLEASRSEYEQLLKSEPKNGEALLGMAAISLRLGQSNQSEAFYLRAIEADPMDTLAQAGLISLRAQADADPVQSESRLKNLIAAQPEVPALHLALGNLYARQKRWNEAQQAYFKAYTGDGDNPDVIFNLAVSLDQLHQPALAAEYYRQALASAANRQVGFAPAQVAYRLRDLAQQSGVSPDASEAAK
jgi:tetratricopeptide (TPR) repeat protein